MIEHKACDRKQYTWKELRKKWNLKKKARFIAFLQIKSNTTNSTRNILIFLNS